MSGGPEFRINLIELIEEKFGGKPARLAKKANISPGAFQRYLNGESIPGGETLIKISKVSGVSIDWLLTGEKADVQATPLPPEVDKLLTILQHGDPETVGFVKGVLESEHRKIEKPSKGIKKGA